jgi:excisionase family DNA binding protein
MLNKDSEFLSARDVARKLGISYKLARAAINDGQIPSTVIGKYRRVTRTALAEWLVKAQPVATSAPVTATTTQSPADQVFSRAILAQGPYTRPVVVAHPPQPPDTTKPSAAEFEQVIYGNQR